MVTRRNFRLVAMLDLFVLIARFERSQPSLAANVNSKNSLWETHVQYVRLYN
jgi:hypothetical protein